MNQFSRRRAEVKNVCVGKNGSPEPDAGVEGKQYARNSPSNGSLGKNCNLSSVETKRKLWSVSSDGAEGSLLHHTRLRSSSHSGRSLHKSGELGGSRETRAVSRSLSASFRREKAGSDDIDGESEELRSEVELKEHKHLDEQSKREEEREVEEVEEEQLEEAEEAEEKRLVVWEVNGRRNEVVVEDIKEEKFPAISTTVNFCSPEISFDFSKAVPCHDVYAGASETEQRMQGLVDVFLWRDVSRSAFVFGSGSFLLLSSSYANDLNFSLISTISYVGLLYLGIVFIHKSIIVKGGVNVDEMHTRSGLREEDAIRLLRLVLPYLNEILLRVKSIFSGDPATTMKHAGGGSGGSAAVSVSEMGKLHNRVDTSQIRFLWGVYDSQSLCLLLCSAYQIRKILDQTLSGCMEFLFSQESRSNCRLHRHMEFIINGRSNMGRLRSGGVCATVPAVSELRVGRSRSLLSFSGSVIRSGGKRSRQLPGSEPKGQTPKE
ncbi:unnamed protein product [Victoria cruziana]